MKKVLALVLAVMMMATVAFAAAPRYDGVVDDENTITFGGQIKPGESLYVYKGMDSGATIGGTDLSLEIADMNAEVTSKNYTITGTKYTAGRDLVESISFDDKNNQLVIKTKEDYTLKQKQDLKVKFTLKGKGKGGVGDTRPVTINVDIAVNVGNFKLKAPLSQDDDMVLWAKAIDATTNQPAGGAGFNSILNDNTVVKFEDIDDDNKTSNYGTVVIACADEGDTEVTFRGYKGDELFLFNNASANSALLKAYADTDAEISFLNFVANQTLNSTATIRFYKDEDSHVYVMKDGKLTNEVKWDDDEGCFVLKTRTLGSYVFSDKALSFTTTSPSNPDTGANDVVGIATALAAVALVSAAAVSLKK